ncbi:MAG: hypothetical protein HRT57_14830 [Crocinitomicaceae bacterium]|nr:hypothetical protein [Crocinitomicaceae bacterium]
MSINSIFLAIAFIASSAMAHSQNDTVCFNANWEKTGMGGYAFYRVISIGDNKANITDFYGNGDKQMTGSIVYTKEALETAESVQDVSSYSIGGVQLLQSKWIGLSFYKLRSRL